MSLFPSFTPYCTTPIGEIPQFCLHFLVSAEEGSIPLLPEASCHSRDRLSPKFHSNTDRELHSYWNNKGNEVKWRTSSSVEYGMFSFHSLDHKAILHWIV